MFLLSCPCSIIKREVEERLGTHGEFGRVSFARLSFGRQAAGVGCLKWFFCAIKVL